MKSSVITGKKISSSTDVEIVFQKTIIPGIFHYDSLSNTTQGRTINIYDPQTPNRKSVIRSSATRSASFYQQSIVSQNNVVSSRPTPQKPTKKSTKVGTILSNPKEEYQSRAPVKSPRITPEAKKSKALRTEQAASKLKAEQEKIQAIKQQQQEKKLEIIRKEQERRAEIFRKAQEKEKTSVRIRLVKQDATSNPPEMKPSIVNTSKSSKLSANKRVHSDDHELSESHPNNKHEEKLKENNSEINQRVKLDNRTENEEGIVHELHVVDGDEEDKDVDGDDKYNQSFESDGEAALMKEYDDHNSDGKSLRATPAAPSSPQGSVSIPGTFSVQIEPSRQRSHQPSQSENETRSQQSTVARPAGIDKRKKEVFQPLDHKSYFDKKIQDIQRAPLPDTGGILLKRRQRRKVQTSDDGDSEGLEDSFDMNKASKKTAQQPLRDPTKPPEVGADGNKKEGGGEGVEGNQEEGLEDYDQSFDSDGGALVKDVHEETEEKNSQGSRADKTDLESASQPHMGSKAVEVERRRGRGSDFVDEENGLPDKGTERKVNPKDLHAVFQSIRDKEIQQRREGARAYILSSQRRAEEERKVQLEKWAKREADIQSRLKDLEKESRAKASEPLPPDLRKKSSKQRPSKTLTPSLGIPSTNGGGGPNVSDKTAISNIKKQSSPPLAPALLPFSSNVHNGDRGGSDRYDGISSLSTAAGIIRNGDQDEHRENAHSENVFDLVARYSKSRKRGQSSAMNDIPAEKFDQTLHLEESQPSLAEPAQTMSSLPTHSDTDPFIPSTVKPDVQHSRSPSAVTTPGSPTVFAPDFSHRRPRSLKKPASIRLQPNGDVVEDSSRGRGYFIHDSGSEDDLLEENIPIRIPRSVMRSQSQSQTSTGLLKPFAQATLQKKSTSSYRKEFRDVKYPKPAIFRSAKRSMTNYATPTVASVARYPSLASAEPQVPAGMARGRSGSRAVTAQDAVGSGTGGERARSRTPTSGRGRRGDGASSTRDPSVEYQSKSAGRGRRSRSADAMSKLDDKTVRYSSSGDSRSQGVESRRVKSKSRESRRSVTPTVGRDPHIGGRGIGVDAMKFKDMSSSSSKPMSTLSKADRVINKAKSNGLLNNHHNNNKYDLYSEDVTDLVMHTEEDYEDRPYHRQQDHSNRLSKKHSSDRNSEGLLVPTSNVLEAVDAAKQLSSELRNRLHKDPIKMESGSILSEQQKLAAVNRALSEVGRLQQMLQRLNKDVESAASITENEETSDDARIDADEHGVAEDKKALMKSKIRVSIRQRYPELSMLPASTSPSLVNSRGRRSVTSRDSAEDSFSDILKSRKDSTLPSSQVNSVPTVSSAPGSVGPETHSSASFDSDTSRDGDMDPGSDISLDGDGDMEEGMEEDEYEGYGGDERDQPTLGFTMDDTLTQKRGQSEGMTVRDIMRSQRRLVDADDLMLVRNGMPVHWEEDFSSQQSYENKVYDNNHGDIPVKKGVQSRLQGRLQTNRDAVGRQSDDQLGMIRSQYTQQYFTDDLGMLQDKQEILNRYGSDSAVSAALESGQSTIPSPAIQSQNQGYSGLLAPTMDISPDFLTQTTGRTTGSATYQQGDSGSSVGAGGGEFLSIRNVGELAGIMTLKDAPPYAYEQSNTTFSSSEILDDSTEQERQDDEDDVNDDDDERIISIFAKEIYRRQREEKSDSENHRFLEEITQNALQNIARTRVEASSDTLPSDPIEYWDNLLRKPLAEISSGAGLSDENMDAVDDGYYHYDDGEDEEVEAFPGRNREDYDFDRGESRLGFRENGEEEEGDRDVIYRSEEGSIERTGGDAVEVSSDGGRIVEVNSTKTAKDDGPVDKGSKAVYNKDMVEEKRGEVQREDYEWDDTDYENEQRHNPTMKPRHPSLRYPNVPITERVGSITEGGKEDSRRMPSAADLRHQMNEELRRQEDIMHYTEELSEMERAHTVQAASQVIQQAMTQVQMEALEARRMQELIMQRQAYEMSLTSALSTAQAAAREQAFIKERQLAEMQNAMVQQQLYGNYVEAASQAAQVTDNLQFTAALMDIQQRLVLPAEQVNTASPRPQVVPVMDHQPKERQQHGLKRDDTVDTSKGRQSLVGEESEYQDGSEELKPSLPGEDSPHEDVEDETEYSVSFEQESHRTFDTVGTTKKIDRQKDVRIGEVSISIMEDVEEELPEDIEDNDEIPDVSLSYSRSASRKPMVTDAAHHKISDSSAYTEDFDVGESLRDEGVEVPDEDEIGEMKLQRGEAAAVSKSVRRGTKEGQGVDVDASLLSFSTAMGPMKMVDMVLKGSRDNQSDNPSLVKGKSRITEAMLREYRQEIENRMKSQEKALKIRLQLLKSKRDSQIEAVKSNIGVTRGRSEKIRLVEEEYEEAVADIERERWTLNAKAYKELRTFYRLKRDMEQYQSNVKNSQESSVGGLKDSLGIQNKQKSTQQTSTSEDELSSSEVYEDTFEASRLSVTQVHLSASGGQKSRSKRGIKSDLTASRVESEIQDSLAEMEEVEEEQEDEDEYDNDVLEEYSQSQRSKKSTREARSKYASDSIEEEQEQDLEEIQEYSDDFGSSFMSKRTSSFYTEDKSSGVKGRSASDEKRHHQGSIAIRKTKEQLQLSGLNLGVDIDYDEEEETRKDIELTQRKAQLDQRKQQAELLLKKKNRELERKKQELLLQEEEAAVNALLEKALTLDVDAQLSAHKKQIKDLASKNVREAYGGVIPAGNKVNRPSSIRGDSHQSFQDKKRDDDNVYRNAPLSGRKSSNASMTESVQYGDDFDDGDEVADELDPIEEVEEDRMEVQEFDSGGTGSSASDAVQESVGAYGSSNGLESTASEVSITHGAPVTPRNIPEHESYLEDFDEESHAGHSRFWGTSYRSSTGGKVGPSSKSGSSTNKPSLHISTKDYRNPNRSLDVSEAYSETFEQQSMMRSGVDVHESSYSKKNLSVSYAENRLDIIDTNYRKTNFARRDSDEPIHNIQAMVIPEDQLMEASVGSDETVQALEASAERHRLHIQELRAQIDRAKRDKSKNNLLRKKQEERNELLRLETELAEQLQETEIGVIAERRAIKKSLGLPTTPSETSSQASKDANETRTSKTNAEGTDSKGHEVVDKSRIREWVDILKEPLAEEVNVMELEDSTRADSWASDDDQAPLAKNKQKGRNGNKKSEAIVSSIDVLHLPKPRKDSKALREAEDVLRVHVRKQHASILIQSLVRRFISLRRAQVKRRERDEALRILCEQELVDHNLIEDFAVTVAAEDEVEEDSFASSEDDQEAQGKDKFGDIISLAKAVEEVHTLQNLKSELEEAKQLEIAKEASAEDVTGSRDDISGLDDSKTEVDVVDKGPEHVERLQTLPKRQAISKTQLLLDLLEKKDSEEEVNVDDNVEEDLNQDDQTTENVHRNDGLQLDKGILPPPTISITPDVSQLDVEDRDREEGNEVTNDLMTPAEQGDMSVSGVEYSADFEGISTSHSLVPRTQKDADGRQSLQSPFISLEIITKPDNMSNLDVSEVSVVEEIDDSIVEVEGIHGDQFVTRTEEDESQDEVNRMSSLPENRQSSLYNLVDMNAARPFIRSISDMSNDSLPIPLSDSDSMDGLEQDILSPLGKALPSRLGSVSRTVDRHSVASDTSGEFKEAVESHASSDDSTVAWGVTPNKDKSGDIFAAASAPAARATAASVDNIEEAPEEPHESQEDQAEDSSLLSVVVEEDKSVRPATAQEAESAGGEEEYPDEFDDFEEMSPEKSKTSSQKPQQAEESADVTDEIESIASDMSVGDQADDREDKQWHPTDVAPEQESIHVEAKDTTRFEEETPTGPVSQRAVNDSLEVSASGSSSQIPPIDAHDEKEFHSRDSETRDLVTQKPQGVSSSSDLLFTESPLVSSEEKKSVDKSEEEVERLTGVVTENIWHRILSDISEDISAAVKRIQTEDKGESSSPVVQQTAEKAVESVKFELEAKFQSMSHELELIDEDEGLNTGRGPMSGVEVGRGVTRLGSILENDEEESDSNEDVVLGSGATLSSLEGLPELNKRSSMRLSLADMPPLTPAGGSTTKPSDEADYDSLYGFDEFETYDAKSDHSKGSSKEGTSRGIPKDKLGPNVPPTVIELPETPQAVETKRIAAYVQNVLGDDNIVQAVIRSLEDPYHNGAVLSEGDFIAIQNSFYPPPDNPEDTMSVPVKEGMIAIRPRSRGSSVNIQRRRELENRVVFDRINDELSDLHSLRHNSRRSPSLAPYFSVASLSERFVATSIPLTKTHIMAHVSRALLPQHRANTVQDTSKLSKLLNTEMSKLDDLPINVDILDNMSNELKLRVDSIVNNCTDMILARCVVDTARVCSHTF